MENKIIIYDTRTLPEGLDIADVLEIFASAKIVVYDSLSTGNLPFAIDVHNVDETEIVRLNVERIYETTVQSSKS